MNDLTIPATAATPGIEARWAKGLLRMAGDAYPENAYQLFQPLLAWVERYLAEAQQPLQLELQLLYLNTSSIKAMMDIFDQLEAAHLGGRAVAVTWLYDARNERVAELAAEFREDCSFPFLIQPQA